MPSLKRNVRRAVALAGLAAAALGASAGPAAANRLDLQATCENPYGTPYSETHGLGITLETALWSQAPIDVANAPQPVTATMVADDWFVTALRLVKANTVDVTATARVSVRGAGLDATFDVPLVAPTTNVPVVGSSLTLRATGAIPSLRYTRPGVATVTVEGWSLHVVGHTDPTIATTFDEPCTADVGQSNVLSTVTVTAPPPTPTPTPATATLTPGRGYAGGGSATSVAIAGNTSPISRVTFGGTAAMLVDPGGPVVWAIAPRGEPGSSVDVVVTTRDGRTANGSYGYDSPPTIGGPYEFTVAGAVTIKSVARGVLPVNGRVQSSRWIPGLGGAFPALLAFDPVEGTLVAAGLLPVRARLAIVPQGVLTGAVMPRSDLGLGTGGYYAGSVQIRVKVTSAKLFGLELVNGQACQTRTPSTVELRSTGEFSPYDGGTVAGTFAIGNLTGCGSLTGVVSPLTAGRGNAIALKLVPFP